MGATRTSKTKTKAIRQVFRKIHARTPSAGKLTDTRTHAIAKASGGEIADQLSLVRISKLTEAMMSIKEGYNSPQKALDLASLVELITLIN